MNVPLINIHPRKGVGECTEALIDGDIIVYACAFVAEKKIHSVYYETPEGEVVEAEFSNKKEANAFLKDNGGELITTTRIQPAAFGMQAAKTLLNKIMEATGASDYRLFLTGKDNFRDALVTYYKKNRVQPKPVHYQAIKDYLIGYCDAEVVDGEEADDALGKNQTEDTIISTIDKDLDMVPGWHYNWTKDIKYHVSAQAGLEFFYTQMLTGDSTDNIPGLFKMTGKRASAKLKDRLKNLTEYEMWICIVDIYAEAGMVDQDKILEIARLLYIRQEEGEELWTPPA